MTKTAINPCPKCGGEIAILAARGGRGTQELTGYAAACSCGFTTDGIFSSDGTRKSAIREWNSCNKERALTLASR